MVPVLFIKETEHHPLAVSQGHELTISRVVNHGEPQAEDLAGIIPSWPDLSRLGSGYPDRLHETSGNRGEMLRQVRGFDQPRPNWSNMLGNIEFMRFSILIRRVTDFISQIS